MTPEQLLNVTLEEYKTLRKEVVSSVNRQYSLVNWSISGIAVLIAALVGGWGTLRQFPYLLSSVVFVAIPAVATAYVMAWSHVISKIAQLGKRLHEIEENVSQLISKESIRQAYGISASENINPFKYLLGWEHSLWQSGVNIRVQATIGIVKAVLACLYAGAIFVGVVVFVSLQQNMSVVFLVGLALAATVFWGIVLYVIAKYLTALVLE